MDLEKLKDYFQNDRFAISNGIKLVEVGKGYCKAMLEIEDRHLNAANVAGVSWRLPSMQISLSSKGNRAEHFLPQQQK